jgi:hypothetical protein
MCRTVAVALGDLAVKAANYRAATNQSAIPGDVWNQWLAVMREGLPVVRCVEERCAAAPITPATSQSGPAFARVAGAVSLTAPGDAEAARADDARIGEAVTVATGEAEAAAAALDELAFSEYLAGKGPWAFAYITNAPSDTDDTSVAGAVPAAG